MGECEREWKALIDVVNSAAPEASTTTRRITLADFKPVQRVGQGDVGSVHLVTLKSETILNKKLIAKQKKPMQTN